MEVRSKCEGTSLQDLQRLRGRRIEYNSVEPLQSEHYLIRTLPASF